MHILYREKYYAHNPSHPPFHFLSGSDILQFHHLRNVFDDAFAFALKVNHDDGEPKIWGCYCTVDRFIKTFVLEFPKMPGWRAF